MFVKRNTENGIIKVSLQKIADEFGTTRGKVRHIMDKFYSENLLFRTTSAQLPHNFRTTSAQTDVENQKVTSDFRTTSAQLPHNFRTTSAQDGIKKRAHSFGEKLIPYMGQYDGKMIREFFNYWTERNESGTKMRFEKEKTFDIARRLARWHKNDMEKNESKPSSLPVGMNLQDSKDKDYTKGLERWSK